MQFFRIKKVKDKIFKSLIFRERKRKYEKESDTYISKVKPVIIYGKAAAGKSASSVDPASKLLVKSFTLS